MSVSALHLCLYFGNTTRLNERLITPFDFLTTPKKKENPVEYICHRYKLTFLRNSPRKARNKITHQSSSSIKKKNSIQPLPILWRNKPKCQDGLDFILQSHCDVTHCDHLVTSKSDLFPQDSSRANSLVGLGRLLGLQGPFLTHKGWRERECWK